ncbi:hypothetical protein [Acetobacter oryzifermentans]|uniref:Uncharacterized protein n=1 Tax=Acetobacter oryzifermentans TaxID=1633874 RepID=A0ABN4NUU4_9PROT|nr:hypothetical protein [Acetobacter oryzifermentans]ANA13977.1 hypothetical protein WG31_08095 [Acetobacter oryzifermentans]
MADLQHLREHTLVRINCFIRNKGGLIVDPICERFIIAGRRIDSELKNLASCQQLLSGLATNYYDFVFVNLADAFTLLFVTMLRELGAILLIPKQSYDFYLRCSWKQE